MNKHVIVALLGFCCLAETATAASQEDWAGTFFTVGPDCYADGTVVRDGEYYALVWRNAAVPFAGFKEGTSLSAGAIVKDKTALLVDTDNAQLIRAWPWAEDGRLDDVAVTFPSAEYKTFASGVFSLYLLDTRRFAQPSCTYNADGSLASVTTNVVEGSGSVQGYVETAGYAYVANAKGVDVEGVSAGKPFLLSTIDNTVVPSPVITQMRVEGDYVILSVKATKPTIAYNAVGAETVSAVKAQSGTRAVSPVTGAATEVDEIELRVPRKPGATSEFFNIIRNPMN